MEGEEILLISGPRQAGKTTLLHEIEIKLKAAREKTYFLDLEDPDYLRLLNKSPKNLFKIFSFDLKKRSYLFVDEVQYLDNPTNFLKFLFDAYAGKIKLIVSGSSAFYLDQKFRDSLAGRKKIFTLLTLDFTEFLVFKNEREIAYKKWSELALSEKTILERYYYEYLVYGGYPKVVLAPLDQKEAVLRELAYAFVKKDVYEANIRQDQEFFRLFKILADQTGCLVNVNELAGTLGISKTAIDNYLAVMQKSFHLGLVRPYFKNVRKELTKMPKAYFFDLGLRNFFKGNFESVVDRDDVGALLENAVFRQLVNRLEPEEVRFWRTIDQKEVDFVIEKEQVAYEVKAEMKPSKADRYGVFEKAYPDFKMRFVGLKQEEDGASWLYPWEV